MVFLAQKLTRPSSSIINKIYTFYVAYFYTFYVVDMIITYSFTFTVDDLVKSLGKAFSFSDLRMLSYFLGLELDYLPNGLLIFQRKYI